MADSVQPLSLNMQLGPQFTLRVVDKSGESFSSQVSSGDPMTVIEPFQLGIRKANERLTLEVGVKSSSLFAGGGGSATLLPYSHVEVTANEAIPALRAVTIEGFLVDTTYGSLSSYAGVSTGSHAPGSKMQVIRAGMLNAGAWIPGTPVYIGPNGTLTQTLSFPDWRRIGYAISPSQVNLDPFPFQELSSNNW